MASAVAKGKVTRQSGKSEVKPKIPNLSVNERIGKGEEARTVLKRSDLGDWEPAEDRPDPIAVLEKQGEDRLQELLPIRYGRMLESPFAFLRGAAAVMAVDLAGRPQTGLICQLCGDAHLSNFGSFNTPERTLVFDLNDFDESLPGPWEFDVKRLAASFHVLSRDLGHSKTDADEAVLTMAVTYSRTMTDLAAMRNLDVWYKSMSYDELTTIAESWGKAAERNLAASGQQARHRDHIQAYGRMTEQVGDSVQFKESRLLRRIPAELLAANMDAMRTYQNSLRPELRWILSNYDFVDMALKVVGIGSVGTRAFVILMHGRDKRDPLLLQLKEANRSVLEAALPPSEYENQAERVVNGQRLMQSSSDLLLGWFTTDGGRDFYVRQLRDGKYSFDPMSANRTKVRRYAQITGWALAKAHARSGDRIAIASYIGKSDTVAESMVQFASKYADQTENDHKALVKAVKSGRIKVERGV